MRPDVIASDGTVYGPNDPPYQPWSFAMPDGSVLSSASDIVAYAAAHPPAPVVGPATRYDPDAPALAKAIPRLILKR